MRTIEAPHTLNKDRIFRIPPPLLLRQVRILQRPSAWSSWLKFQVDNRTGSLSCCEANAGPVYKAIKERYQIRLELFFQSPALLPIE